MVIQGAKDVNSVDINHPVINLDFPIKNSSQKRIKDTIIYLTIQEYNTLPAQKKYKQGVKRVVLTFGKIAVII